MQIIKLVKAGFPDSLIGFDSLPEGLIQRCDKASMAGYPKHWNKLGASFHALEYTSVNKDIEIWQGICAFVKRVVDPSFRLLDNLANMAVPCAPSSKEQVSIEPEDVKIIPIPAQFQEKEQIKKEQNVIQEASGSNDVKLDHSEKCETKGRGKLTPGCPRCEQITAKKLVTA